MKEKTYFISFEGIDGSGKDTQLFELLKNIKEDNNYPFGNKYSNIYVTREPTRTTKSGIEISDLIRTTNVDGKTASKLYIQDRIEHTKSIREILKFSHVLTSRYDISTLTYQVAQGEDFDELYKLHKFNSLEGSITPDISLIFEIPVEISFKRINKRGEVTECFEKIEFQKKLIDSQDYCLNRLKEKGRKIIRINANQTVKEVTREMLEKINQFILNSY